MTQSAPPGRREPPLMTRLGAVLFAVLALAAASCSDAGDDAAGRQTTPPATSPAPLAAASPRDAGSPSAAPATTAPPSAAASEPATERPAKRQRRGRGGKRGGGDDVTTPTVTVTVVDFEFLPDQIAVVPGTTVLWQHRDPAPHTVTFDGGVDSGRFNNGESYTRTFDRPGEYPYICTIHPSMEASVTVRER